MQIVVRGAFSLLLFPVVGLLAGCNSRGSLHSQGPWGSVDTQRSYPQYSAPWGRSPSSQRPLVMSGLSYSVGNAAAVVERPVSGPQRHYRDSGLPVDPQPPGEVPTASRTMTPVVEPISPSSEPSMPATSAPSPNAAVSPPGVFTAPRRASSYAGTWKVRVSEGRSCLVHLSNTASLDLYKASVSKCDNETLRRVNLWKFEGGNVTLLTRGVEIARLEGTEASLSGTFNQSGAPLQMTR